MMLTIEAIRYKGQPLTSPLSAVFDEQGGKLGRSSDNHFVLADEEKVVSGLHATIEYDHGGYYYLDTSLNGTQLTNRNQRIHHKKILLKDQDELRVGDYDLVVSITGKAAETPSDPQDFEQRALSLSMFDQMGDTDGGLQPGNNLGGGNAALLLDDDTPLEFPDPINACNNDEGHAIDGSFVPPDSVDLSNPVSELPDDLSLEDFFSNEQPVEESISGADFGGSVAAINDINLHVRHAPQELSPVNTTADSNVAGGSTDWRSSFLKAAGIDDASAFAQKDLPEFMHIVGTVLREMVDGLMTVLRGRSELKSHLRVSMTTLKPTENNPLKFSPTVEDALTTFLSNNHPGFIDAVEAVREGYEDIKNHQLAINSGVQASLDNILKRFDPQHISERFEEGLILQKKAKCWDEYKGAYQQIVEEALEDFFGDQFVRAYEKQINKLRANRNTNLK